MMDINITFTQLTYYYAYTELKPGWAIFSRK